MPGLDPATVQYLAADPAGPNRYVRISDGALVQWVNPSNQESLNGASTGFFQLYAGTADSYVPVVSEA